MIMSIAGIDLSKIIEPYTNAEITSLWVINEDWQRVCNKYLGAINTDPKRKPLHFTKRTNWIVPCIAKRTLIPEDPTFLFE